MAYVHLEDYTGSDVKIGFKGLTEYYNNFHILFKGNPNPDIYSSDFNDKAILIAGNIGKSGQADEVYGTKEHQISSEGNSFDGDLKNADGLQEMNEIYLSSVSDVSIRELITPVKWPYESDEGKKIKEDGCAYRFMLPSRSEIDNRYTDGDGIGESSDLYIWYGSKVVDGTGYYANMWTRTYAGNGLFSFCKPVSNQGWSTSRANSSYVYPILFTLPLSIWVNDSDGSLKANLPPSASFSKSNYGTVSEFPSNVSYTVTDPDGDQVTVTEKIGDLVIATKTLQSGETGTFSVSSDQWLKVLNGQQTLKVELSDGKATGRATAKITKKVTTATVSHASGFETEELAAVAAMRLIGDIPEDAEVKIELTNNFSDDSPVWEDASAELLDNRNYAFKNQTAASGNVFNFRITLSRGPSDTGGYLSGIVGTFQGADD